MMKKRIHSEIQSKSIISLSTKRLRQDNPYVEDESSYEGWFKIDPIVVHKKLKDQDKQMLELDKTEIKEYFEKEYLECNNLNNFFKKYFWIISIIY